MPVEAASAWRASPGAVAVIAALGVEAACFRRRPGGQQTPLSVHRSGPGALGARRAAEAAVGQGATGLVSFGLAGALSPRVAPGDVLLPRAVIDASGGRFDTDEAWRAAIASGLAGRFTIVEAPLLCAAAVLRTPETKARAAAAYSGTAAVDMESGAIAAVAARARLPFVAVRAAADAAADTLPPGIELWVDAEGRARLAPLVDAAVRPSLWPVLWTLARRYRRARHTLESLASVLATRGFFLTDVLGRAT